MRSWMRIALLCGLVPLSLCAVLAQAPLALRWKTDSPAAIVELTGLNAATLQRLQQSNWKPAQWQRLLAVYANEIERSDVPPMLGSYRIVANAVQFQPQFPLEPGVSYRAVVRPQALPGNPDKSAAPLIALYQLPLRALPPTTTVTQIYPTADALPENLLKFYVHFSAPMRRGGIYEYIRLRETNGKEVELPFLEIDEELWDATLTRLTLIIDPGRIKRGVLPLEQIGPALETGKRYTLDISRAWKDATGTPLKADFQKSFTVGQPDREPIDPARWQIHAPAAASREALVVNFSEPIEHALALRLLVVTDETGQPIAGKTTLTEHERRWLFVPDKAWQRGRYQLVVQTTLEDLAGNNIGKPFEVDLVEGVQRSLTTQRIRLEFEVR